MRKQLYLDIKNRLKSIVDDEGLQVFKHFDLWNQQVAFLEQETPFEFPAVFIEFTPHQWITQGRKYQEATIVVRLHIVTRWFAQTADYSPSESEALEYLDLPNLVLKSMMHFNANQSGQFVRIASQTNHNHGAIVDSIEDYSCRIFDASATQFGVPTQATPVINKIV